MSGKLIAFDMDGTLYRTETSFIPTMKGLFEEYGMNTPHDKELLSIIGETTGFFKKWLSERGVGSNSEEVFRRISELEYDAILNKGELYEGVEETLRHLKEKGYRIALCTNGPKPYWRKIIDKFGLDEYFDDYQHPGFEGDSKADMLRRLEMAHKPDIKIMVGDRNIDREAALYSGFLFYGAVYGYCYEEREMFENKIEKITDLIGISDDFDR